MYYPYSEREEICWRERFKSLSGITPSRLAYSARARVVRHDCLPSHYLVFPLTTHYVRLLDISKELGKAKSNELVLHYVL